MKRVNSTVTRKRAKKVPHTPLPWRRDGSQLGPQGDHTVYLVGGEDGDHPTIFVSSYLQGARMRRQFEANVELILSIDRLHHALAEARAALEMSGPCFCSRRKGGKFKCTRCLGIAAVDAVIPKARS